MQKLLPFTKRNAFCAMGGRGVARLRDFLECESVSFRFGIEKQGVSPSLRETLVQTNYVHHRLLF